MCQFEIGVGCLQRQPETGRITGKVDAASAGHWLCRQRNMRLAYSTPEPMEQPAIRSTSGLIAARAVRTGSKVFCIPDRKMTAQIAVAEMRRHRCKWSNPFPDSLAHIGKLWHLGLRDQAGNGPSAAARRRVQSVPCSDATSAGMRGKLGSSPNRSAAISLP